MDSSETARSNAALERAIREAGSGIILARMCGVKPPVVTLARATGHVPAKMAIVMQEYLGIPARESAPWLFEHRHRGA
jgi:hypothetical protein